MYNTLPPRNNKSYESDLKAQEMPTADLMSFLSKEDIKLCGRSSHFRKEFDRRPTLWDEGQKLNAFVRRI